MREYKSADTIIRHAPTLTDEDVQNLNECYVPYIFYRDDKKRGVQECTCSRCRQSFDVPFVSRMITPEQTEFLQAGHNQKVKCPKCGAAAYKKQKGIARNCRKLYEYQRAVFVKPISKNEVYLIYCWSEKFYQKYRLGQEVMDYGAVPCWEVNAIYYITPNQQRCFIYDPFYRHKFVEYSIREPFMKTWAYMFSAYKRGYCTFGIDSLKKTFLRYYDIDTFLREYRKRWYASEWDSSVPFCKYLCYFARYPSMEWLLKQGYFQFVVNAVELRHWSKRTLNWQAKGPYDFFKKLTKPEIREFAKSDKKPGHLLNYCELKKIKQNADFDFYLRFLAVAQDRYHLILETVKIYNVNLTRLLNYLEKQSKIHRGARNIGMYFDDYINMAEELDYDLTRSDVLMPKRLVKAHDTAVELREAVREERRRKEQASQIAAAESEYAKRFKTLEKLYGFDNGIYKVVIPSGCQHIIDEGKALQHCVGGYAVRHCEGATTILFIRLCKEEDKPLLTVEINDKTLRIWQVHGKRNREPTKAEQAFIDAWLEYVRTQKAKRKKKAAEAA